MIALLRYLLSLLRIFWMLCLWLWFLACFILLLVTLLFPRLSDYRPQIEQWVSIALDQPITIGNISTYWLAWQPTIALQQVRLLEALSKKSVIEFARLEVTLNVLASLQQGQLLTSNIMMNGSQLTLLHHSEGHITLAGLSPSLAAADNTWFSLWLLQQPAIFLHATKLTWLEPKQPPLTFTNAQLTLQTQGKQHQLWGKTDLPPTPFKGIQANRFSVEMTVVNENQHWQELKGQLAVEQLQVTVSQGRLTLPHLEGQWLAKPHANGTWQVEVKRLLAYSSLSPKSPSGKKQLTTSLDLSPFTFYLSPLSSGGMKVSGQVPVFFLDQLQPFLTLVKPDLQATVNTMRGTFQNIDWSYTPDTWHLRFRFADIATQANDQLPSIKGFSGQMNLAPDQGTLNFDQTAVTIDIPHWYNHPLSFKQLHGNLQWQRTKNSWQFSTTGLQFVDNEMHIQLAGTLEVPLTGGVPDSHLKVTLRNGQFARLRYYVPEKFWPKIQLEGNLRTAQLLLQSPNQFDFTGDVAQVSVNYADANHLQAEIKDLGGHFHLTSETGTVNLHQANVTLNFPQLYSHSLSLTHLTGDIHWELLKQQWHLTTNKLQAVTQQMPIQVAGSVDIPTGKGVPYSNLQVTLRHGQLAQVAFYLPDKHLTKVVHWLNEAQLTGNISSAEAVLKGPVNALFDDRLSRFEFKANVQQAHINYAPEWPPLKEVAPLVVIKGHTLTITTQEGKLLNSQIRNLKVEVPDLTASTPVLNVVGHTRGPAIDGLRFVDQSPLHKTVSVGEATLDAKGQMDLQLHLTIPLSVGTTQVQGKILFKNNILTKKSVGLTLTKVKGTLNFDNNSVSAKNMQGKLFGKPVKFALRTLKDRHPKRTRLHFTGEADGQFFQQLAQLQPAVAHFPWPDYLSGTTHWQTTIEFPNGPSTSEATTISVKTDLLGLGINLPAPLDKTPEQRLPVSVIANLFTPPAVPATNNSSSPDQGKLGDKWLIRLIYGNVFNGIAKLDPTGLERGTLLLGTTEAPLPNQPILDIQGHLPTLSLTEWQPVFKQLKLQLDTSPSRIAPQPSKHEPPIVVELHFDQLEAVGQTFANLAIQAKYTESQWQAALTGTNIEGQVSYHSQPNTPSLELMFNRLAVTMPPKRNPAATSTSTSSTQEPVKEESANDSPDPRRLPPITFYCNTLRIGDIDLGRVNLTTQPNPAGLDLLLEANATGLNILAKAQWQYVVPRHQTYLQGSLSSDNTGKMLRHLGFPQPPLEGGLSQLILNTHWLGTPYGFNLATLTGRLSILAIEGQIIAVEPGVGRLIGLFDVQTLPRRLALDFSDVFGKGLGFASLVGFFSLHDGKAQTDNLILQGPVAQVEIRGHTDFVAHNYDQLVIVTPHLSNTLPVAGTLAGGFGVGAVTLVVQQMLQTAVEKPINYQYHVTGSWEQPQIVPLSSEGLAKK
jgi:uncharacterized protein (TIGR02099 family)